MSSAGHKGEDGKVEAEEKWTAQVKDVETLVDRGTKLVKEYFTEGEQRNQLIEGLDGASKRIKLLEKNRRQQQMAIDKVRLRLRSGSNGYQTVNINKMYAEAFTGKPSQ